MGDFPSFFREAMGRDRDPVAALYPYQVRFAEQAEFAHLLRAPNSAGKTATVVLGWLYRVQTRPMDTPRRVVYCLPMRVLVEQSVKASEGWIENLGLDVPVHVLRHAANAISKRPIVLHSGRSYLGRLLTDRIHGTSEDRRSL
jgi:CRISPR-associated endonuclease/helicase Cas3